MQPHERRVRRAIHRVLVVAFAVCLAAPMLLGPAFAPILRMAGGLDVHKCACGMKQGECGCPECERLEHERLTEKKANFLPIVRSSCTDDDGVIAPAALPEALASARGEIPAPIGPREALVLESSLRRSQWRVPPPTPPPERV